ncbi:MarR family winged helix-turn-helix transcriptional regulator [Arthrobacter sp. TMN-49]
MSSTEGATLVEQSASANHRRANTPSMAGALPSGDIGDLYAEVKDLDQAMRRLDISNGRLRSRLATKLGISVPELNAMAYVGTNGDVTPKQLAGEVGITTGSVTSMIDRLEKTGFMVRRPNPLDRRSLLLGLTPAGDHALGWVSDYFHMAVALSMSYQDAPSRPALAAFLNHAAEAMTEMSGHIDVSTATQPAEASHSEAPASARLPNM